MAKKILTWATVDPDNAGEMAEFHLEMYRELLRDCLDDDPDLETFERMWEETDQGKQNQEFDFHGRTSSPVIFIVELAER